MTTTDVLVVGAGPAGLATATALAQSGTAVTVIDSQDEGANTSRAAVVHARTLEVLKPLGVADVLVGEGIHAGRFTIRDRDRVLLPIGFGDLPTEYPYTLMVSQARTEAALLARFTASGGTVVRPRTLTGLAQDESGVTAELDDGSTVRAAYLVGADGMHSTVRDRTGIGFEGGTYGESFSLADVRLSGDVPDDEVILYFSPAGMVVVAPLPGGVHRIVATVDEAPEHPTADFVQRLLDTRGPDRTRAQVHEVLWGSRFRVHHRVATAYRSGRVFLAGDAAHVHSPAGGQGMNTGIHDGVQLGNALAAALRGHPQSLDDYETGRKPVAEQVVALADRLTRLATADRRLRPIRNVVLSALGKLPPVRRNLALRLSGLVYR
ncbi:2-polyprenyl-6-methoxyphenol hydroxylase-like FAD-dependent oxidoreductase [Saccharothrix tamanrassetensis]|uniref:2-polyprenyl-6-methoxyphenol hydroxylase-like FAD-dependent oxidoreductase n=1 Tax=Saccharothrix tamanrassetensis TaxID=1051531 RepID=A0A841CCA1_9PSEU|nr:FAD-dependent oxidoreductase [Saccharothrix tamanrassetensis]MBB5956152.1 2-polyprenyl-6-methoxyphenol hydroxylase-like FAD-dependent oxidoreductase [Saccharothrix tamanrassetensis]